MHFTPTTAQCWSVFTACCPLQQVLQGPYLHDSVSESADASARRASCPNRPSRSALKALVSLSMQACSAMESCALLPVQLLHAQAGGCHRAPAAPHCRGRAHRLAAVLVRLRVRCWPVFRLRQQRQRQRLKACDGHPLHAVKPVISSIHAQAMHGAEHSRAHARARRQQHA